MAYDFNVNSDILIQNKLPLEIRSLYSKECEWAAEPYISYDDPRWVEVKGEFKAQRTQRVYWTVVNGLGTAQEPLSETVDKPSEGFTEYQRSFTVNEYGMTISWTLLAETFHWTDPDLRSKITTILGPSMGKTKDVLCRNAFISGLTDAGRVTYMCASARSLIPATGYLTITSCEAVRDLVLEENFMQDGGVTVLGHPRAFAPLMNDSKWVSAQEWAGAGAIIKGLLGTWRGIQFQKAATGVLPNAGTVEASTTLAANVSRGAAYCMFTDTTGFNVGDVVTIGTTDGSDEHAEEFKISAINAGTGRVDTSKEGGFSMNHTLGDAVVEAVDIYPVIFMLNGAKPMGRGDVIDTQIIAVPPTDAFARRFQMSWYFLLGYGLLRPQYAYLIEVAAPAITIA